MHRTYLIVVCVFCSPDKFEKDRDRDKYTTEVTIPMSSHGSLIHQRKSLLGRPLGVRFVILLQSIENTRFSFISLVHFFIHVNGSCFCLEKVINNDNAKK